MTPPMARRRFQVGGRFSESTFTSFDDPLAAKVAAYKKYAPKESERSLLVEETFTNLFDAVPPVEVPKNRPADLTGHLGRFWWFASPLGIGGQGVLLLGN